MSHSDATVQVSDGLDLEKLLRELDDGDRALPEAAIRRAREHRDVVIPQLIAVLEDAAAESAAGRVGEGSAPFYAICLLGEFKAVEALPAVLKAMRLPGDHIQDLFGDLTTEAFPQILAALVGDRLAILEELINDQQAYQYSRWSAATALAHLCRMGQISRETAVEVLRKQLRSALERSDEDACTFLAIELLNYVPPEANSELRQAFERGLVDEMMLTLEEVEETLARETPWTPDDLTVLPSEVDTLEIVEPFFREDRRETFEDEDSWINDALREADLEAEAQGLWSASPRLEAPAKVGRNEPCPCGSGRKYKKCCGREG